MRRQFKASTSGVKNIGRPGRGPHDAAEIRRPKPRNPKEARNPNSERRFRALTAVQNLDCKTLLKVVKHWQIGVKRLLRSCLTVVKGLLNYCKAVEVRRVLDGSAPVSGPGVFQKKRHASAGAEPRLGMDIRPAITKYRFHHANDCARKSGLVTCPGHLKFFRSNAKPARFSSRAQTIIDGHELR